MRILQVITRGDEVGGAQTHVESLAIRLLQDGHEVLVVVGSAGDFTKRLTSRGIAWQLLPSMQREISLGSDIRAVLELRKMVRHFRPTLVACHSSKAGIIGRLASWGMSASVVFTAHGWAFTEGVKPWKRRLYGRLEWAMSWITDSIICVSEYDRQSALQEGIPEHKTVTIHNGVPDVDPWTSARAAEGNFQAVMVARFDEPKDQALLVRAVSHLPNLQVTFVGEGSTLSSVKALANSLGIVDRCRFLGHLDDVHPVLAKSDVFCLVSKYEGFPLSTIEAMRSGLPTIVSRVGGAPEAVEHGVTGFLVTLGSQEELITALEWMMEHPEDAKRMGQSARQRYVQSYTHETMYLKTISVYLSVTQPSESGS